MRSILHREVASPQNPLLKRIRSALRRGELTSDGYCVIEGSRLLEEAIQSKVEIGAVVVSHSAETQLAHFERVANLREKTTAVPDKILRALSQTETPQGILALVRLPQHSLEQCLSRPGAVIVVLVGLQDPGNLGTILRATEAFAGTACLLTRGTVSLYNAKAVRAAAGSLFRLPVFSDLGLEETLQLCREHRLQTVGLSPHAPVALPELDLTRPLAFFIGNEGGGLPNDIGRRVDTMARIPMAATVESLNAAMATGIALYEMAGQRGGSE